MLSLLPVLVHITIDQSPCADPRFLVLEQIPLDQKGDSLNGAILPDLSIRPTFPVGSEGGFPITPYTPSARLNCPRTKSHYLIPPIHEFFRLPQTLARSPPCDLDHICVFKYSLRRITTTVWRAVVSVGPSVSPHLFQHQPRYMSVTALNAVISLHLTVA